VPVKVCRLPLLLLGEAVGAAAVAVDITVVALVETWVIDPETSTLDDAFLAATHAVLCWSH
jgi:hypothetical protein